MKKRLLPLLLALVMCLGLAVPAMAAEAEDTPEVTLEEVIPCELVNPGWFNEGLAWVEADGMMGYMDKTGEIVISAEYDTTGNFHEGLSYVRKGDKWGFINKDGKVVIPLEFAGVRDFSEGLAVVRDVPADKGGKLGYINTSGEVVIPCKYDEVFNFSEGLATVKVNDKWGYINQNNEVVIPCEYDGAGNFVDGLAWVVQGSGTYFINKNGEKVITSKYNGGVYTFSEGISMVVHNNKYGFIDATGKEIVAPKYDEALIFSDGFAAVKQGNKWGYIDKTGKEVISCQYAVVGNFVDGFAAFVQDDGKCGFIDKSGNVVVSPKYDRISDFSDGMARVGIAHSVPGTDEVVYTYGFIAINKPAPEVTATVSEWAKEQVDAAAAAGLIADGLGEDYTANITRAQFAAVAVKLYEAMSGQAAPADSDKTFTDTSDPAVLQAAALEIVKGNEDGTFNPDSQVTREDAATMLSRVYTKLGGEIPAVEATSFADDGDMNGYARASVAFMSEKAIINGVGDNKFDPKGSATIEQALILAVKMAENLK